MEASLKSGWAGQPLRRLGCVHHHFRPHSALVAPPSVLGCQSGLASLPAGAPRPAHVGGTHAAGRRSTTWMAGHTQRSHCRCRAGQNGAESETEPGASTGGRVGTMLDTLAAELEGQPQGDSNLVTNYTRDASSPVPSENQEASDPSAQLWRLTVAQLKAQARELGLPIKGNKSELIDRLVIARASKPNHVVAIASETTDTATGGAVESTAGSTDGGAIDSTAGPAADSMAGSGMDSTVGGTAGSIAGSVAGGGMGSTSDGSAGRQTGDSELGEAVELGASSSGNGIASLDHDGDMPASREIQPQMESTESETSSSGRQLLSETDLAEETMEQLRERCRAAGLAARGNKATLISRLVQAARDTAQERPPSLLELQGHTVSALKERCKALGLPVRGSKQEIVARLMAHHETEAPHTDVTETPSAASSTPPTPPSPPAPPAAEPSTTSDASAIPSPAPSAAAPPPSPEPSPSHPDPEAPTFRGEPVPVIFTDHRKKRRIIVRPGQHPEDIATEMVKGLTSRFSDSTVVVAKGLNSTVLALRAMSSASTQLLSKGFMLGFQHWHQPESPEQEDKNFAFVLYRIERFKLPVKETFKVARMTYPPKLAAFLSRKLLDFETPSYCLESRSPLALIQSLKGCLITRKIMHRPFKDLLLFVRVQPDYMPRTANELGKYVMQLLVVKVQRAKPTALQAYRWESEQLQELEAAAKEEIPLPDTDEAEEGADGAVDTEPSS